MRSWYKRKKDLIAALLILVPAFIGLSRESAIDFFSGRLNLTGLKAEDISERECGVELCEKRTTFSVSGEETKSLRQPSVGFYGALLDSYVKFDGVSVDKVSSEIDLKYTWTTFRIFELPKSGQSFLGKVDVVSVSPPGTKKIGMDSPYLYFGERRKLETLQFVFSLFNIHFYLFLAFVVIGVAGVMITSSPAESEVDRVELLKQALLSATALFAFTTIFDDVLHALGMSKSLVGNLPRMFWGPTLIIFLSRRSPLRAGAIALWIALLGSASVDWVGRDFFQYNAYRWMVFSVSVFGIVQAIRFPKYRFALAYVVLAVIDCASIHGVIPVKSAVYLSPLAICGLFVSAHLSEITRILDHHRYWYERKAISKKLEMLRRSGSVDRTEWHQLLVDICYSLAGASSAGRVSICYVGLESPLIVSVDSSRVEKIEDGQLPPVFARVIQTKEPLWWVSSDEIKKFIPDQSIRRKEEYRSSFAAIVPILVNGDAYGAVALTDFEESHLLVGGQDLRHQKESIIGAFVDILSAQLVRERESSSNATQKEANDLIREYAANAILSTSLEESIQAFLDSLSKRTEAPSMYFEFIAETNRLHFVAASNMEADQVRQWREIPFRAIPTNRTSPFAITINERRSVFVDNIQTFFNFLKETSINVLSSAGTRGFVCSPVCFGENVVGLVCALDTAKTKRLSRDIVQLLEIPLKYLAYQIEQHRMHSALVTQERTLSRFADPNLTALISRADRKSQLVLGDINPTVMIVHDMRGSTAASRKEKDAKRLAEKFARVYEKAASIADEYAASYDKCNGDGTITTLPVDENGNGKGLLLALRILSEVHREAQVILGIEVSLVCVHRGVPFRGVMGTTRRLAWDICGADISDTFSIEKAAKKIDGTVFAVSEAFVEKESFDFRDALNRIATCKVQIEGLSGSVLMFNQKGVDELRRELEVSGGFRVRRVA